MAKDYYKRLDLPRTATEAEIKAAYRKLARDHHPDKGGDPVEFQEIGEAYAILGDPLKKQEYDAAQSVALVTDLDRAAHSLVEEYFAQFSTP